MSKKTYYCGKCDEYHTEEVAEPIPQPHGEVVIICANLCCSGLKSCKECEKCQKQEEKWEEEFEDKFGRTVLPNKNTGNTYKKDIHGSPYDIKIFIRSLLSYQKAELREKIEGLDYPEQFQDLTHFRNGYDFAIEDVLKLLEEDIK